MKAALAGDQWARTAPVTTEKHRVDSSADRWGGGMQGGISDTDDLDSGEPADDTGRWEASLPLGGEERRGAQEPTHRISQTVRPLAWARRDPDQVSLGTHGDDDMLNAELRLALTADVDRELKAWPDTFDRDVFDVERLGLCSAHKEGVGPCCDDRGEVYGLLDGWRGLRDQRDSDRRGVRGPGQEGDGRSKAGHDDGDHGEGAADGAHSTSPFSAAVRNTSVNSTCRAAFRSSSAKQASSDRAAKPPSSGSPYP